MRSLVAVVASLLLLLALAAPVAASEKHGSCAGFGEVTAGLGQAGGFGQLVKSVATSGAGAVSGLVADEHGLYCEER